MEEKLTLRITKDELKKPVLRNALAKVIAERLRIQKNKPYFTISSVEYEIIRRTWSWVDVTVYAPKEKDRINKKEIGKFQGKRCVLK